LLFVASLTTNIHIALLSGNSCVHFGVELAENLTLAVHYFSTLQTVYYMGRLGIHFLPDTVTGINSLRSVQPVFDQSQGLSNANSNTSHTESPLS
jgi:hypothetical protein